MTASRANELKALANHQKWPNWEFCMYVNNVTVGESLELLQWIGNPHQFDYVRRGIESYTGQKVRHKFVPWRWHVCSVYELANAVEPAE